MLILIVEDDPGVAGVLTDYFRARGHQTDWAANALQAMPRLEDDQVDVIILDCGLPKMDGLRFLQFLRNDCASDVPVLMLTARDRESDKLDGFAAGADDYVVKPFSLAELEARLLALTRRRLTAVGETVLRCGGVIWDGRRRVLSIDGQPIAVQTKVLQALVFLLRDPGAVLTLQQLEEHLWGDVQDNSDKLRQVMYQVRKVLSDPLAGCTVVTVHGQGYRLDACLSNDLNHLPHVDSDA